MRCGIRRRAARETRSELLRGASARDVLPELLFEDICVCVMSADHTLAKRKRLTLDEYLRCSHLVIDIIDGEQPLIANRLRELGVARRAALTAVGAPVELEPFHYFMFWHPRLDNDPAHQWLRDTIRSVAAATVGGPSGRR